MNANTTVTTTATNDVNPETILNLSLKKEAQARQYRRDAEFASAAGESRLAEVWSDKADDLLREVDELLALV